MRFSFKGFMQSLLFVFVLIAIMFMVTQVTEARQYNRYIQLNEEVLATDCTTYALAPSTKSIKTVELRAGRTSGSYLVNLSTYGAFITDTSFGTGAIANTKIRTQGMYIGPASTADAAGVAANEGSAVADNVFPLTTEKAYYIVGGDDDTSALTNDIRVYDEWIDGKLAP